MEGYASEIASKWNTNDEFGNYLGFVTKFAVIEEEYLKYEVQTVGGERHKELWVPAEDLERFNSSIEGRIQIVNVFIGENY